ncbi:MAG: hypothetical protein OXU23_20640 [Candidatus Poribacteria bacterium]|nr:hypothetical protein [Candidatus Poribacteria bacterium]
MQFKAQMFVVKLRESLKTNYAWMFRSLPIYSSTYLLGKGMPST